MKKDMSHVVLITALIMVLGITLFFFTQTCFLPKPAPIAEEPTIVHVPPIIEEPVPTPVIPIEPVPEIEPIEIIEPPVVEEPVVEVVEPEPIVEVEEPIIEEPVIEEPIIEEPIIEEPVIEEPIIEEPVIEEPVIEEPIIEEPVIEEPIIEEPVVEPPPVIEEPVIVVPVEPEVVIPEPEPEVVIPEPEPEPIAREIIEEEPIEEPIVEEEVVEVEPEEPPPPPIPPVPFLFEPMVMSEDEYNLFYAEPFDDSFVEDDFWADFFIVGEDSVVAYDDGFYFLNLFVNDERVGDVEVEFEGETRWINSEELFFYVNPHITRAASERIFGDNLPSLSLEQLNERGVQASYDSSAFAIYLTFSLEDMPERMVSITTTSINRRQQYGMSGAVVLKPVKLAVASSLSLYGMIDYPSDFSVINNRLLSLSVSNRASIFGVGLNFYFTITPDLTGKGSSAKVFNFGSWSGFYDFVETSQRLSFGNVGSSLSKNEKVRGATNIGFTFEKNYSYGTGSAKGSQFEHRITLVEPSTVIIEINGQEVFNRRFQPGTYRLRDFVFTQGANQILIRTVSDSGEVHTEYVDMGYDYRLLGKGDTLYSFGFSVPRTKSPDQKGLINIPWVDGQYLSYHPEAFTATYSQQIGVTDTFTLSGDLAYSPGFFSGTFNGVLATMVGTSQLQLTVGFDKTKISPSFNASLGHRFSFRQGSPLGTLSANISHSMPALGADDPYQSNSTLSLSYSGSITERVRYTLSSNIAYDTQFSYPSWSASFSTGFSPFKGFSISGSITASGSANSQGKPVLSAQISGSYSFSSKLSSNISTSVQNIGSQSAATTATSSMGVSWRPSSNDSMSFSLNAFKFNDPTNNTMSGYWNHNGNLASFSVRQQISNATGMMTTTVTANTSLAFGGWAVGVGRSVNDSFLLVRPTGELRSSSISVARSLDSSPSYLSRPLGSALYNSISPNMKNSVVVFATGATDYSAGHSFVFEATPRSRQSFVAKLVVEPSFTVSGLLYHSDGSPYIQYSSPVYQVQYDEEGNREFTRDDSLYLFTDQEGRYILSEVKSGTYIFDLQVEDTWYAIEFVVPTIEGERVGLERVLLLEEFMVGDPAMESRIIIHDALTGMIVEEDEDVFGTELATGYDAEVVLDVIGRIDEESFWSIIFPPFDESGSPFDFFDSFDSLDPSFVRQEHFEFDESIFDALVGPYEGDGDGTQVVTAAP